MYGGKDLRKRYLLSLEWKRVGVMDNESGTMRQKSLESSIEKSDQNSVDGMR